MLSHVALFVFPSVGYLMELIWAVLQVSWAPMGQSWGPLGALLGRFEASWASLGLSWAVLGPSSPSGGFLGAVLGQSIGPSQVVLGPSGGHLGPA